MTTTQNRDKANGQYAHDGDWSRLCKCGHELGVHTAARVGGKQPCMSGDFGGPSCDCQAFKRAPKPLDAHACTSVATHDGAFCDTCGETLS